MVLCLGCHRSLVQTSGEYLYKYEAKFDYRLVIEEIQVIVSKDSFKITNLESNFIAFAQPYRVKKGQWYRKNIYTKQYEPFLHSDSLMINKMIAYHYYRIGEDRIEGEYDLYVQLVKQEGKMFFLDVYDQEFFPAKKYRFSIVFNPEYGLMKDGRYELVAIYKIEKKGRKLVKSFKNYSFPKTIKEQEREREGVKID
jgi:hypothetical protein